MTTAASRAQAQPLPFDDHLQLSARARVPAHHHYKQLCSRAFGAKGERCLGMILADDFDMPERDSSPGGGWTPAELEAAYQVPLNGGSGKLIATLIGVHYPNAEADLAVYRQKFNLPPCTKANGCFMQIDENGGTNYPNADSCDHSVGEASLDIQMLSAGCPACKIMLIEPKDGGNDKALSTAIAMGALGISFSWGEGADVSSEKIYTRPGIALFAASGDGGYEGPGMPEPAALRGVVAVGGTYVDMDSTSPRGWKDSAALFSGSGCSGDIPKPSWQTDTGCNMRMVADISINGNNVANYCTDPNSNKDGWAVTGGTSASSPFALGALTALGVVNGHFDPQWIYEHKSAFIDVTTTVSGGPNKCAGKPSYFCVAGPGYDGPTGWGVPNAALLLGAAGAAGSAGGSSAGNGGMGGENAGNGGVSGGGVANAGAGGTASSAAGSVASVSGVSGVSGAAVANTAGSNAAGGSAGVHSEIMRAASDDAGCSCSLLASNSPARLPNIAAWLFGLTALGRRAKRRHRSLGSNHCSGENS